MFTSPPSQFSNAFNINRKTSETYIFNEATNRMSLNVASRKSLNINSEIINEVDCEETPKNSKK